MNCPESSIRFDFIQKSFFWGGRWTNRENCPKDNIQGITEHTSLFFWVEPLEGILKDQKELLFRVSTWNSRASLTVIGPPSKLPPTRNKGIVRDYEAPHGPFIRPYWRTCDHLPRLPRFLDVTPPQVKLLLGFVKQHLKSEGKWGVFFGWKELDEPKGPTQRKLQGTFFFGGIKRSFMVISCLFFLSWGGTLESRLTGHYLSKLDALDVFPARHAWPGWGIKHFGSFFGFGILSINTLLVKWLATPRTTRWSRLIYKMGPYQLQMEL